MSALSPSPAARVVSPAPWRLPAQSSQALPMAATVRSSSRWSLAQPRQQSASLMRTPTPLTITPSLSATSLPYARPERIIKEVPPKTQYASAQPFLSTRTVEPSQVVSGIPSYPLVATMAPPVPPLEPPRTEIPPEPEGSLTPPVPGFDVQEQPQRLYSSMSPPAIKEQPQRLYSAIASPAIETKLPLLSSVSSVAGYSGSVLPGSPLPSAVPALQAPIVPIASPQLSSVLPIAPVQTVPQGISSQPLMATPLAPASPQLSVVAPASPLQTISAAPPLKASPLASARQVSPGPIQIASPRTSPRLRSPSARFRSSSPNVSPHMSPRVSRMTTSPRPSRMESSPWKYLPPPLPAPLPAVAMGSSVSTQPPIPSSLNLSPRSPTLRMVSGPPPPLQTPHMVDPENVEKQRQQYAESLASNLEKASQEIAKQVQMEKQELAQKAALEKAHYDVMMDQFIQQQALVMDQQTNVEIMRLQRAAVAEKSYLEKDAVGMKMAYEEKKAEEDMMLRNAEIERQFREQTAPLTAEAEKVQTSMAAHGMLPGKLPVQTIAEPFRRDWWNTMNMVR